MIKEKRFEELQAIGYNNLNVKKKYEYNQLAAALYTTEGGRFAEHTGKAPVWIDNRDPSRSRSHNIKVWGSGEIGEIMLDFEWNEMKEKQGWAEVALPMWEKKLWNGSGAPTLRTVTSVAADVAGAVLTATGVGAAAGAAVAFSDDLLFAGLDYGLGYKDGMDVGKDLGRKAAVTAISTYTGAKFAGMSNQVLQTAAVSSINTTASTAVYSTSLSDFRSSIASYSTWNSTVTSTIGAGVTSALGKIDLRDGNKEFLSGNTFDTKNIAAFNSKIGDLTAAALDYKLTGTTTFNVLDVADLGLSVINKRAKEDGSGGFIDSITGEKTTKNIGVHKGILEWTIGGDNSGLHLGTGGYNISYGNIASSVAGFTEAAKVADWKYSSIEKSSTLNSINMLSYTTVGDNQTLAKEIWDGTKKVNYTNTGGDRGNFKGGDTINISDTLLGKGKEASAKLATVISHEGSHVYGNRVEGIAHSTGALTYAQINKKYELAADKEFSNEMIAGILNPNSWVENVGDTDHWRMTWGGQIINDGQGWLVDENGKYINIDGSRSDTPEVGKTLGAGTFDENGKPLKGSIETGLLNIIGNMSNASYESFTDEQIKAAQALMMSAENPMVPSNPDEDFRKYDWSKNSFGQKLNMTDFMETAGPGVSKAIFDTYYNNTVDSQISKILGVNLGFDTGKEIPKNQYVNYVALAATRLTDYLKTGNAKQSLNDKYFQTLTNEKGESTTLYKLDKNNPFIDQLLGQHDFNGINSSIDKDGCNFMTQLSIPQLLTGNIIKDKNTIDSIWKEAVKGKGGVYSNSYVYDPESLSSIVMKNLNLNLTTSLGYKKYTDMIEVASRKTINYDKYIKDGEIKYHTHFVLSDVYGSTIYNPGYRSTGDLYEYASFYLRKTK